jgi:hypothetical protein
MTCDAWSVEDSRPMSGPFGRDGRDADGREQRRRHEHDRRPADEHRQADHGAAEQLDAGQRAAAVEAVEPAAPDDARQQGGDDADREHGAGAEHEARLVGREEQQRAEPDVVADRGGEARDPQATDLGHAERGAVAGRWLGHAAVPSEIPGAARWALDPPIVDARD